MAPLYRDTTTNALVDLPENVGNHPVLGRNLEPYVLGNCEFEEDKVVTDAPVSTQRLSFTSTPVTTNPEKAE